MMRALPIFAAIALVAFATMTTAADPPAADAVVVTLPESVSLAPGVVRIGGLGTITGGNRVQRDRIARVDLTDLPQADTPVVVIRRLVEIRLALAGIDGVKVAGAERVMISCAKAVHKADAKPAADSPVLVRTRQRVTMTVRLSGVEVSALGEAVEDGKLGQLIRLKNIDSQKPLVGKVIGPNAVEIETGGRP